MRALPFAVLFTVCALCGVSGGEDDEPTAAPVEDPDDIGAMELAAIRGRLACEGAEADYCAALDRFGTGDPAALPQTLTPRLGRCLFTRTHRETAAHMVADSTGFLTGEITPDNPEEQTQIDAVVNTLRAGQVVPPTDPVQGFVAGLRTSSLPRERTRIEGRSRVYGQREREYFRQTGGGEVIVIRMATDGPLRIAIFR